MTNLRLQLIGSVRMHSLGGTDMKIIMDGDPAKIHRLWLEKTGQEIPDDLSEVWPVRRGQATEALNIEWFERKQQCQVSRRGEVVRHAYLSWATVTLDGWIDRMQCPLECKDVGGHEPFETVVLRYQPQMQWQCEVTGADQVALSVIIAGREPVVEYIERDQDYAAQMVTLGTRFWIHVRDGTAPVDLPTVPPPIAAVKIYDMASSNQWGDAATTWLETAQAADAHDDAAKMLKALVPGDAKRCVGHGVYIIRDRAGRLSLREESNHE